MDAVGAIVRLMLPGRYLYGFQEKTSTHVCVSCKRCRPKLRADSIQSSVFCTCCMCLCSLKLRETRKASQRQKLSATCNPTAHTSTDHQNTAWSNTTQMCQPSRQLPDQIQLKHSRNLITVALPSPHWLVRSNFHCLPPSQINNDFPSNFQTPTRPNKLRLVLPNPTKAFFCLQQKGGCSRNPTEYHRTFPFLANRRQYSLRS
jgi:hypothetical protein